MKKFTSLSLSIPLTFLFTLLISLGLSHYSLNAQDASIKPRIEQKKATKKKARENSKTDKNKQSVKASKTSITNRYRQKMNRRKKKNKLVPRGKTRVRKRK